MSITDQKPRDQWQGDEPDRPGPAFHDEDAGRVTLSLEGPALTLPGEIGAAEPTSSRGSQPEPHHLDAWNVDRLKRSSLPPSITSAVSVFPSAPPANDTQQAPESGDLDEGDLLALVGRARPALSLDLVTEMTERFALGDYSGALRAAELLLGQDANHTLGQHYAVESTAKLEDMYTSRLRMGVLRVVVGASDIAWLGLDPQVAALLQQIAAHPDYESLLAHCGMPRLWALRALVELLDARVIRLV